MSFCGKWLMNGTPQNGDMAKSARQAVIPPVSGMLPGLLQSAAWCSIMRIQFRVTDMGAKNRVTVNLGEPEYRDLLALSEKHQVSLAWLGRRAIAEFLDRSKVGELQMTLSLGRGRQPLEGQG